MKKHIIPIFLSILMPFSMILGACSGGNENSGTVSESESTAESKEESANESFAPSDSSSESPNEESTIPINPNEPIVRPEGYPTLCGSFMQPSAFKDYSKDKLVSHLQTMYDVGIDVLVLQWSFETQGSTVISTFYESSFDSSDRSLAIDESGKNFLDNLLSAAEQVGVKVFVGLNENAEWWVKGVDDKNWLAKQAELGIKGASQIYEKYKEKYPNALHGWYFVFEFYNMQATPAQLKHASYLLNLYRDGLYQISPEMPMMLSPFISSIGAAPAETGRLWKSIFANTNFRKGDIFCCQDSVGAGHITIDRLDDYYKAIKDAIDTKEELTFWANNENFTQSTWTTAPLDRFVEQLEISDKYVEAHITFAYSHYQHPDMNKTGYHLAYKHYYENGSIPESALSAPTVEYSSKNDGVEVAISGSISNSDNTLMGVNLYKDGELCDFLDFSGNYGKESYKFLFSDTNATGSGTVKYSVCGVDYYGNDGEAYEFSVDYKAKNGRNIALGKSYTLTFPPEANYPDENGITLTDGKLGQATYSDTAWAGFLGKPEIIVDLGSKQDNIYAIELSTLGGGSAGVFAPTGISVYASDDGKNFTNISNHSFDADAGPDLQKLFTRSILLDGSISARYIKLVVTTNQSWIFIDEVNIYAE